MGSSGSSRGAIRAPIASGPTSRNSKRWEPRSKSAQRDPVAHRSRHRLAIVLDRQTALAVDPELDRDGRRAGRREVGLHRRREAQRQVAIDLRLEQRRLAIEQEHARTRDPLEHHRRGPCLGAALGDHALEGQLPGEIVRARGRQVDAVTENRERPFGRHLARLLHGLRRHPPPGSACIAEPHVAIDAVAVLDRRDDKLALEAALDRTGLEPCWLEHLPQGEGPIAQVVHCSGSLPALARLGSAQSGRPRACPERTPPRGPRALRPRRRSGRPPPPSLEQAAVKPMAATAAARTNEDRSMARTLPNAAGAGSDRSGARKP